MALRLVTVCPRDLPLQKRQGTGNEPVRSYAHSFLSRCAADSTPLCTSERQLLETQGFASSPGKCPSFLGTLAVLSGPFSS